MHKLKSLIIVLSLMNCLNSYAQEKKLITFEEAVAIGLKNNVDVLKSSNELVALETNKTSTIMSFLPSVSADLSATRQEGQQFQLVEDGFEISNVQADRLSGGIGANLSIFEGFRKVNNYRIAELNKVAQEKALGRSKQELVFNIAQQYLQILLDEELLKIAEKNVQNQQDQLSRIRGFVEGGLRPQADLFSQQASVKQLELALIEAENTLLLDKASFASLLLLPPFTEFEIEKMDDVTNGIANMPQLQSLYEEALSQRLDLQQLQLQTESAQKNIAASRAAVYPSLSAFYNYSSQYSSLNDLSFRNQLTNLYPTNVVGLNLNIPIFSNFNNKANVSRAKVTYENNQLDVQNLKRTIFEDVQNAYLNYQAAEKRLEVSQVAATSAEEAYNIQSQRYDEGLANLSELAVANQSYVDAQSREQQAIYTFIFQQIILDYQVGVLDVNSL
jgi:outer membrane protein